MLNNPDITTIDQLTQRNKIMRYKITRPEPKFYIYELYSLLVFYNIETIYNFIINNNDNINKLITNINLLKNLNYEVEIMTNHHNLKYLVITEKDQPDTPISMILSEGILALLLIFIKYLEFEISGKTNPIGKIFKSDYENSLKNYIGNTFDDFNEKYIESYDDAVSLVNKIEQFSILDDLELFRSSTIYNQTISSIFILFFNTLKIDLTFDKYISGIRKKELLSLVNLTKFENDELKENFIYRFMSSGILFIPPELFIIPKYRSLN